MDRAEIKLVDRDGRRIDATIKYKTKWKWLAPNERVCTIVLRHGEHKHTGVDENFFYAFFKVRESLEALGLYPYCYGASRHVRISGMAMDMGGGLTVYHGLPEGQSRPVFIFDSGPDVDPVSVVEYQKLMKLRWRDLERAKAPRKLVSVLCNACGKATLPSVLKRTGGMCTRCAPDR